MTASNPFSYTPPERFEDATFERYHPKSQSQTEALEAARSFTKKCRDRRSSSWVRRLKTAVGLHSAPAPQGLYLVGPAGTGKTHLLAAVYHDLTPTHPCAFLHSSELFRRPEPPAALARHLAERVTVCCLDEVEIDDPAHEMRLAGFMNALHDHGIPLVATSNIEPGEHLSRQFSGGRFERFLRREFWEQHRVVRVRGADFRQSQKMQREGHGWIGPPSPTREALEAAYEAAPDARWWTMQDLRHRTTETAHTTLIQELTELDRLCLESITVNHTDDAFRLLRLIDALYTDSEAPALFFTARRPPRDWFAAEKQAGLARDVAKKFRRTVSRLHAMCEITTVNDASEPVATEDDAG